ncbi:MAG: ABC transporter ATP-binding protein [Chloroflexi bacterium]|nr:MAG: ABC transporter ATP-binding protein [Chloroflexota bacterium]
MSPAIEVKNLSKQFRRFHPDRPTTLIETLARGWGRLRPKDKFWVLSDVNFTVEPGAMLGVIGHNGAGKSTLLRLLGGVGKQDKGQVVVNGRIGALLDLGTGFHPELTGRENVFVAAIIGGLTHQETRERFDDIVQFAELEEFIDNPLRTYSTGMQMRLAFSVATHIEPEILLIDEVLAVGDLAFQRKCLDRIAQFKAQGCTIVLVSHDATLVRELCDKALWLRRGGVVAYGESDVVVGQYVAEMTAETQRRTPAEQPVLTTSSGKELRVNENRFGSMEMTIREVALRDETGAENQQRESGSPQQVTIRYHAPDSIESPIFSVTISREDGFVCYDTSTAAAGITLPTIHGMGEVSLFLERLDLIEGDYFVDVGVFEKEWAYAYDYHWHVYPLTITGTGHDKGVLRPPHQWQIGHEQPVPVASLFPSESNK